MILLKGNEGPAAAEDSHSVEHQDYYKIGQSLTEHQRLLVFSEYEGESSTGLVEKPFV